MVTIVGVKIFSQFLLYYKTPSPHFKVSEIMSCLAVCMYILGMLFCSPPPPRTVIKSVMTFMTKSFSDLRKHSVRVLFPSPQLY